MNDIASTARFGGPIDLGAEPPFRLGALRIDPSARQVASGSHSRTIEPRVMQVLVALAQADGRVVSRELLIARCWSGRVVGDDAINSCVAKVRALANLGPSIDFEVETIPRVGYRLQAPVVFPAAPQAASPAIPKKTPPPEGLNALAWTAGIVVVLAMAAVAVYTLRPEPAHWVVVESHDAFVATPLIELYPALSPDGTMLAYSAGPTIDSRHIFLRFLKGGDPIQLTHDEHDAASPAWSPDGRTIAYVLFQEGHPCRLMASPVPAGSSRQLGRCRRSERSNLARDASGNAIYYSDNTGAADPQRIFKLDLASGRNVAVTAPLPTALSDNSPLVSPDGRFLLYRRETGGERVQIRVHSLIDGGDRLVAGFDDGDDNPAWSPDGKSIFISRWKSDQMAIWDYPQDGGKPEVITAGTKYIGRIATAANGLLVMEVGGSGPGAIVAFVPHSAAPPTPLDDSGIGAWSIDYASDGTLIALGHLSNVAAIWIAEPGESLRELVPVPKPHNGPIRWSPDGTRFAYVQQVASGYDIPVLSRAGAPVATLHFSAKECDSLAWTADSRSIITDRLETKGWRLWRTDVTNPMRSVATSGYGWKNPRVHGAMLFAVREGMPGVWRIDGSPRRITPGPPAQFSQLYLVDGRRIDYYDDSDPAHPALMSQSIEGGAKTVLLPLPVGQEDFEFSINPKSGAIVTPYQPKQDTDLGLLRLEKR